MGKLHTVLFALCAVAVLACAGLSVPLIARSEPEPCPECPVADPEALPSPTTSPPGTRDPGPLHCLIGSWVTVDETMIIKFYTDADPFPFTTSGRYYEFHPDGTAVERNNNIQMVGHHNGNEQRQVVNGWRQFTWSATGNALTYIAITAADLTYTGFDQRGQRLTITEQVNPQHNETNDYTCSGTQVVESNSSGYRSVWQRTADFGVYG